jgi:hypothetical protein
VPKRAQIHHDQKGEVQRRGAPWLCYGVGDADRLMVEIMSEIDVAKSAIAEVLTTRQGEVESDPGRGFAALELNNGRNRSRSGLDRAGVISTAEEAILRSVDGVTVQDIEPEMAATGQVSALNVRFEIISTGDIGELRVEIPV